MQTVFGQAEICTLSSIHWQQASEFPGLQHLNQTEKQVNATTNLIIIIHVDSLGVKW